VKFSILSILTISIYLFGCAKDKTLARDEIISFINDEKNGLKQTNTINDLCYTLTYWPKNLLINKNHSKNNKVDIDSNVCYFLFSISFQNKDITGFSSNKYDYLIKTFSHNLPEIFCFELDSIERIYPIDFIYPRMYGLTSKTSVLVAVEKNKILKSKQIIIQVKNFLMESEDLLKFSFNTFNILESINLYEN
jgi:hypothetical protein